MSYQPLWRDGKEVGGQRDCSSRFMAMSRYIVDRSPMFPPGFTMLDFGCYGSYFGMRFAESFSADVTAVDDEPFLLQSYALPSVGMLRVVPARMSPTDLGRLLPVRVGLCLSVLHHQPDWSEYLDVLAEGCDVLFIENAHPEEDLPEAAARDDIATIDKHIIGRGGSVISWTPGYDARYRRPLYALR